jgi:hypothetical protein
MMREVFNEGSVGWLQAVSAQSPGKIADNSPVILLAVVIYPQREDFYAFCSRSLLHRPIRHSSQTILRHCQPYLVTKWLRIRVSNER